MIIILKPIGNVFTTQTDNDNDELILGNDEWY